MNKKIIGTTICLIMAAALRIAAGSGEMPTSLKIEQTAETEETTVVTEAEEATEAAEPTEVIEATEAAEITEVIEATEAAEPTEVIEATAAAEIIEVIEETEKTEPTEIGENSEVTEDTEILSEIPEEILALLERGPELEDYVYSYPEKNNQEFEIDLKEEALSETIPLLMQWDERWGYQKYGTGLIGYTGCAPTCLSMVALYLTHNPEYTPLAIAEYADKKGYYVKNQGTDWSFMSKGCRAFGIRGKSISPDEESVMRALEADKPVICSVGPGDFTDTGHYIVLAGYTEEGLLVNDPFSRKNSEQLWPIDRVLDQVKMLWAYSPDE